MKFQITDDLSLLVAAHHTDTLKYLKNYVCIQNYQY